jgi:hypothetical protein
MDLTIAKCRGDTLVQIALHCDRRGNSVRKPRLTSNCMLYSAMLFQTTKLMGPNHRLKGPRGRGVTKHWGHWRTPLCNEAICPEAPLAWPVSIR